GDDDLLGAGVEVALGLRVLDPKAGRLDDDVHAVLLPRQPGGGFAQGEALDLVAIDDEGVGALDGDGAGEAALRGVVLQEVREVVGWHQVVERDDVDLVAQEPLVNDCAEYETADAAESVDSYFYSHDSV